MTTQKMFGTDGVRAPVGMEPMTPQTIMRLAHACGQLLGRQHTGLNPRPVVAVGTDCLLYTSPSPRDQRGSRMPSSA